MSTATSNKALSLYRSILKAHRKYLPSDMRQLGDRYVQSEFRLHKKTSNNDQLDMFFTAWQDYLDQLLLTAKAKESIHAGTVDVRSKDAIANDKVFQFGADLPQGVELSKDQQEQLEKLRQEARKVGKGE